MTYFCLKELFKMELIIFSVLSSNMSAHKCRAKEQDIEQFLQMPLFLKTAWHSNRKVYCESREIFFYPIQITWKCEKL